MKLPKEIRVGLVGGAIVIYLSAVGMIESFMTRPIITGLIDLSTVLIATCYLGAAYFAARPQSPEDPPSPMLKGVVAGAVAGALVGLLVLLIEVLTSAGFNPRVMFVSLTPTLVDKLSFGQSPYLAIVLQTALGALLGVGVFYLLKVPAWLRSLLARGALAVVLVALAAPLFIVIMRGLSIPDRWIFRQDGLTIIGALFVAGMTMFVRWYLTKEGGVRPVLKKVPGVGPKNVNVILWLIIGSVLSVLPWIVNTFISDVLGTIGLYILLGLGLNIVVGFAGLLDLGYVAFYAVGAYTVAVLTARSSFLVGATVEAPAAEGFMNFWVAMPFTIVAAIIIGVIVGAPVLRLRGDYLAIVTLGFGEIIRTLAISDWLKPYLGGPQGITNIPQVPFFGFDTRDPRVLYYLILGFVLISFFVALRLKDSRVGRAWAAMREDEDVAEGMGVSVIKYKLLAFIMGAAVGCLGGAFFAAKLSVVNPGSFTLLVSINVLAVVVLGGMGSVKGVVLGAAVLVGLPELLREFSEYRLHIYGAILVAIMILRPEGLIPDKRRARELHTEEDLPMGGFQPALGGAE